MSKAPEHFRPFNIEQAKAGAPIGCRGGFSVVQIVKFDAKKARYPVIGVVDYGAEGEVAISWCANGAHVNTGAEHHLDLVMLPLGMCEGKPVFVGDKLEQRDRHNESWVALDAQVGHKDFEDSRWLSPYPKTRVAKHVLAEFFSTTKPYADDCVDLANYAIASAIQDGDVVPAAMLDAVAKNVRDKICRQVGMISEFEGYEPFGDEFLAAIIKRVKEGKV